jgi:Zn-dependent metalloprotease
MRRFALLLCLALVATAGRVEAATSLAGSNRTLTGVKAGPYLGTPEVAARAALKDLAPRLPKLSVNDTLKLEKVWEYSNGQGSTVRFSQVYAGYPVLDASVTVRLSADGRVLRVSSSLQSLADVPLKARISQAEAIRLARSSVKHAVPPKQSSGARLVIANGRLAWDVYVKTIDPTHAITVTLDAATGEYLFQREHAKSLTPGQANIFKSSKEVKAARNANGSFDTSKLAQVTLPGLVNPAAGLPLNSDVKNAPNFSSDIAAYNCCPTMNCDGQTPPPKYTGTFHYGQYEVPFETIMCDEKPLPVADANGDFYFTPPQEPTKSTPMGSSADSDPFAVVMAYNHATEQLKYMRRLEPNFKMGPNAQPLRVTANYLQPDFEHASGGFGSKIVITTLSRFDNAQFAPAGLLEQLYGMTDPEYKRDFDSVMLYQGTSADFAYDAQVVAHEFTHGVVEATAQLQDYAFDEWGVTGAPGAMNEGFADFWAAARFNDPFIGEYVGDLSGNTEGSLRSLENDYSCPSVLSGEVHWDSQHFSAGIWGARKAIGKTEAKQIAFDAAVLRAMPTIDPFSSYENAVLAIVLEVETAMGVEARDLAAAAFTARGFGVFSFNDDGSTELSGCERAVDVSPEKPFTPINEDIGVQLPPAGRFVPYAPAPIQFRVTPPAGATKVTFRLTATDGRSFPSTRALFKADGHVAFSMASMNIRDDADTSKPFASQRFTADLEPGCGDRSYYLAIANNPQNTSVVQGLSVTYEIDEAKKAECDTVNNPDPNTGSGGDAVKVKSGCQTSSSSVVAMLGLGVWLLARRRRMMA